MFFSAAAFGLVLASSVAGKVWNIDVGDTNGDTKFNPEAIFADVGDQVVFTFHQKNHTATRSSFAAPCSPVDGGFDSGFMPVAANQTDSFPTYTITVEDTNPIWVFCRQGENTAASHCGKGMVFAVNCPSTGANTFDNFKSSALKIGADLQASAAAASTVAATSTDSSAAAAYTGPWTTADYGTATIAAAPTESVVTETVSLDSAVWTTTYSSYPGSPDPTPSSLTGNVIKVVVGGSNGELTFSPDNVSASPRDIISFEFHQKNHTATQSSFAAPCVRLKDATTGSVIGVDSGFMPVDANATEFPVWNVTVNDTAPLWFYCRQHKPDGSSHCGAGMVFAVNAVEDSPRNFSAFKALATTLNGTNATGATTTGNGGSDNGASAGGMFSVALSVGAAFAAAAVLL
ncbi:hypothetical protein L226DRAFT_450467 [Lentinus tigrinus ALCF2SS1-7]|uniref:uncharacterized protein n=1 Tax=Lentinus tigrinus ALCF2SS1-7 TaxID=1328758 RepID=UPI001165CA53|nr:hypothetical protein L226DRAFT_450467 [Lentinus tigrinus ALCF2SS1-7]